MSWVIVILRERGRVRLILFANPTLNRNRLCFRPRRCATLIAFTDALQRASYSDTQVATARCVQSDCDWYGRQQWTSTLIVTIQLTPPQLRQFIDAIQGLEGVSSDLLAELQRLSGQLGVKDTALANFFRILDEAEVRLVAVSERSGGPVSMSVRG